MSIRLPWGKKFSRPYLGVLFLIENMIDQISNRPIGDDEEEEEIFGDEETAVGIIEYLLPILRDLAVNDRVAENKRATAIILREMRGCVEMIEGMVLYDEGSKQFELWMARSSLTILVLMLTLQSFDIPEKFRPWVAKQVVSLVRRFEAHDRWRIHAALYEMLPQVSLRIHPGFKEQTATPVVYKIKSKPHHKQNVESVLYKTVGEMADWVDNETDQVEATIGWIVMQALLIIARTLHGQKEKEATTEEKTPASAIIFEYLRQFIIGVKTTDELPAKWRLIHVIDHLLLILGSIKIEPELRDQIAQETARLIRVMGLYDPEGIGNFVYRHSKEIEVVIADRLIVEP